MCGDGGAAERRRARRREDKARRQYKADMEEARKQAAEEAEKDFQRNLQIQEKNTKRMTKMIESARPKDSISYAPTQVKSNYDDADMGVRSAKAKRKKSNLGNLRIKLNPSLNIASQGGGSSTNLG